MPPTDLQQALLTLVNHVEYKPAKPKVIARALGLNSEGVRDLKRVIKRLVKQGRLAYGESHYVLPAQATGLKKAIPADEAANGEAVDTASQEGLPDDNSSNYGTAPGEAAAGTYAYKPAGKNKSHGKSSSPRRDRITGEFHRVQAGYGFVRPSTTPRDAGRTLDIYIAAKNAHDAASGDKVLIRVYDKKRGGRPGLEGEILEIIERETNQFVGTYFERAGQGKVQIDGKLFTAPIDVGDPGAKGVRENDKVVVEMVRFPSHLHDGEGVITKVLGGRGEPGVDTLSIIHEFNLPGDFAEDTLEAARAEALKFDESIPAGRMDFTGDTVITIDPVDARDFDDAISLVKLENGHWRLGVHIADVSHFVQLKTALEREALDRATSVYLPDQVIPMLPEIISNNLASLQPGRVRYTMTAVIEMTAEGVRVGCDVYKGAIKSQHRFAYEEVDDYLANREAWREKLPPDVHRLVGDMHTLAMILRARRFKRGSLELSLRELKIDLDDQGRVKGAHLVENTESHQIIEEFMLAANEAVADKLYDAGIPFMRRVHEAPDPRKLQSLTGFAKELGFETESLESRFAIQDLLAEVHGLPQAHAVNYAVLRSMQKAIYSPEEIGHYALASECYCHFTSPIRRYPDLTIHRLLAALIQKKKLPQDLDALYAQSEHCSEREQRAAEAERELTKVKLLNFLSTKVGLELDGVITGVEDFGLFVRGVELPAEGLVHVTALSDDIYRFDRATHSLTGRRAGNAFRLGDALRMVVARVDVDRRELDFRLITRLADAPKPAHIERPARPGRGQRGEPEDGTQQKPRKRTSGKKVVRGESGAAKRKTTSRKKTKRRPRGE